MQIYGNQTKVDSFSGKIVFYIGRGVVFGFVLRRPGLCFAKDEARLVLVYRLMKNFVFIFFGK